MSYLKRLTVSLRSQVDHWITQVEDHEAVVEAAINDARNTLAQAKVRMRRVERDGEKLRTQLANAQKAQADWRRRAKTVAEKDENTALECLRRSHDAEQQAQQLQQLISEHEVQQHRLQQIIADAERRVQEKIQRRNLMSTRESAVNARQSINDSQVEREDDWDRVFDRWEERITSMEIAQDDSVPHDSLEYQFSTQEKMDTLRDELKCMLDEDDDTGEAQ